MGRLTDTFCFRLQSQQIRLFRAILQNDKEAIKKFTDGGKDLNRVFAMPYKNTRTLPLCFAAYLGSTEMIEALLDHGANPLLKDDLGKTAKEVAQGHTLQDWKVIFQVLGKSENDITPPPHYSAAYLLANAEEKCVRQPGPAPG